MPRFILINETTRHTCFVSANEIRDLIDIRTNPGGYTDLDRCLSMIEHGIETPRGREYMAFPVDTPMGKVTIHVEGRMDIGKHNLVWVEAGHRCGPGCFLRKWHRIEKQIFGYQK